MRKNNFVPNDRVEIGEEHDWAAGATGHVSEAPAAVRALSDGWVGSHLRKLSIAGDDKYFYWIKFDRPQYDSSGDGPYEEAEIDSMFVEDLFS